MSSSAAAARRWWSTRRSLPIPSARGSSSSTSFRRPRCSPTRTTALVAWSSSATSSTIRTRRYSAAQQIARFLDENAVSVNVPEYHEVVTLRRSSTPDNIGMISLEGELARVYHNMSVDYDRIPRQEMPKLAKNDRRGLFLEINQGYSEAQAIAESDRCLKCNFNIEIIGELCIICGGCVDVCPMDVIHMVDMSDIVDDGSIPAVGEAKKWQNGVAFFLDETACIRCALCVVRWPTDAITMNRLGTVMPAVGNVLPKVSIDYEIHLHLTVAAKKAVRPLPMYDPVVASGYKQLNGRSNGNGNGRTGMPREERKESEAVKS